MAASCKPLQDPEEWPGPPWATPTSALRRGLRRGEGTEGASRRLCGRGGRPTPSPSGREEIQDGACRFITSAPGLQKESLRHPLPAPTTEAVLPAAAQQPFKFSGRAPRPGEGDRVPPGLRAHPAAGQRCRPPPHGAAPSAGRRRR